MEQKVEKLRQHNKEAQKWKKEEETWMAYAASQHVPINGTFELTPRCNLSCKMCYVRLSEKQMKKYGRELSAEEWIKLAGEAQKAGTLYVLLTGGEPLLHPEFEKIYRAISKMGFITTIYTNATLIDEKIQVLFEELPPWDIGVTLYGASRETYEKVCGNPTAFDQAIKGLERLKKIKTNLEIRTTFIKDNVADLESIYQIAEQLGGQYRVNPEVFGALPGVSSKVESCRLSPKEAFDFMDRYLTLFSEKNKERIEDAFLEKSKKRSGFELEPVNLKCLAAKAIYSISWKGHMTACNTFSVPYTEPLKVGFLQAWNALPGLIKSLEKPKECENCPLDKEAACANCPAMVYAETGSFQKLPEYICAFAREREARKRKL